MRLYPENAIQQLEFDKIRQILSGFCLTPVGREAALGLPVHIDKTIILTLLNRVSEYLSIVQAGLHLPNDFSHSLSHELKLLSIEGSVLDGPQFLAIRKLAANMGNIYRWFDNEKRLAYPALSSLIADCYYEKAIEEMIDDVLDEGGKVKDNASEDLFNIRTMLSRKRAELRRYFDRIADRMQKKGYLSEIGESFMNGRRVLAVFAEHKRMVRGVLHSESDSRRTCFIEPEETTELNNEVFSLENQETKEEYRIRKKLTADLSMYSTLLKQYLFLNSELDLTHGKAKFAVDIGAVIPAVSEHPVIRLRKACHPLLLLYNRKAGKETIPVTLELDQKSRILVISGPNAGGKTVSLKTAGLLQLMLQSGLAVPAGQDSEMGIFKQLFLHIGDTQSLEFELSTYSSQLKNMKYFTEFANGRTLFFIDELGSGSDPNLGGAFAEVILEELAARHAIGIVTTHYLNLKIMASKVPGMINGAMEFDEKSLRPLYRLHVGRPGSSYTFAIAERIGLDKKLIDKARSLVDADHFRLDKLLTGAEQQMRLLQSERSKLEKLVAENEKLKKEMQQYINKEKHIREIELLKQKNRITEEKIAYLKNMERSLKAMVIEWRKAEDKNKVVPLIHAMLFKQKERISTDRQQKKFEEKFEELQGEIKVGDKVKMKQNRQVGMVKEIRGKKALLQVGKIPITVSLKDLVPVKEK